MSNDAIQNAKSALDRISKERDKKERSPESFDQALEAAKSCLEQHAASLRQQLPPETDIRQAQYAVDKIGLVRGNSEHVDAAIKEAKAKIDELAKQQQQQPK